MIGSEHDNMEMVRNALQRERDAAPEVPLTTTSGHTGSAGMAAEEEVVINRSPSEPAGVAGMFENIFGSQQKVRTSAPSRGQAADVNARRLRSVIESR